MNKTGAFNPRKFKLTIESWEGEDFTVTFDKGPDCWPVTHGLPLDLKNRMFYQDMADEIERFVERVIDQMQFIATSIDGKGRAVEPYGWGWISTRGGSLPEWRLIDSRHISGMEAEGWKVCEVEHLPYQNPDTSTIYVIVPPTELPDNAVSAPQTSTSLEKSDDEQVMLYSREWLERERRKAWQEGYAAGWKDQECDFPQYTSENPYKETIEIEKEGE